MNASASAREIFETALEQHSPEQWPSYLQAACGGDGELQAKVQRLLDAQRELGSFMDRPAAGEPPRSALAVDHLLGSEIGPYKLLEQIGEGGMGIVYVAEQRQPIKRHVALKIIKPGMDTRQVIARFEAERQALAMMDHPHIARVIDGGSTEQGRPYFVMELVRGVPITEFCDAERLTIRQRLELFVQVCQAVQHAHQKGIIHRDIKPSNVLVTRHDDVPVPKVIDFGVAKAINQTLTEKTIYTQFAQLIGTPLYMSPEQAQQSGLDIDTRSDVYTLGVLLYELLTGTTPFLIDTLRKAGVDEMRRIIREEDPPQPSQRISSLMGQSSLSISLQRGVGQRQLTRLLGGDLDWIVMRALEKDRERRYQSASDLAADAKHFLDSQPVTARPPSVFYRFRKFTYRNRTAIKLIACVAAALLIGAGIAAWQTNEAVNARSVAAKRFDGEKKALSSAEAERRRANEAEALSRARALSEKKALLEAEHEREAAQVRRQRLTATVAGILSRAKEAAADNRWEDVLTDLARCVELTPEDRSILSSNLAVACGDHGNWHALNLLARRQLELARHLSLDDPHFRLTIRFLDAMQATLVGNEQARAVDEVFDKAALWLDAADWEQVQADLVSKCELGSADRLDWQWRIISSLVRGDQAASQAFCEASLKKIEDNPNPLDVEALGWASRYVAYAKNGPAFLDSAQQALRAQIEADSSPEEITHYRKSVFVQLMRAGRFDEAFSELHLIEASKPPNQNQLDSIDYVAAMLHHHRGDTQATLEYLHRGDKALLRLIFSLCFDKGYGGNGGDRGFRGKAPFEPVVTQLLYRRELKSLLPRKTFHGLHKTDGVLSILRAQYHLGQKDYFAAAQDFEAAERADPTVDLAPFDAPRGELVSAWLNRHAAEESIALGRRVVVLQGNTLIAANMIAELPSGDFQVEFLNLNGISTDESQLRWLNGLKGVKRLWLSKSSARDSTLAMVADYPKLGWLGLNDTAITSAGLWHLRGMSSLTRLELAGCTNITDEGLQYLVACPLQELRIMGSGISDRGLESLSHIESLQDLRLYGTAITDKGLEQLSKLPRLISLDLGNADVTRAGCDNLIRLRPDLVIAWNGMALSRQTAHGTKSEDLALEIDTVLALSNDTRHFICTGYYHLWLPSTSSMSPRYPVGVDNWHGVWNDGLDAGIMTGGYSNRGYFFRGDEFLEVDLDTDHILRRGRIGKDDWFGVWTEGLDGAIKHPDGFLYFFRGADYQKYDPRLQKVVATSQLNDALWSGVSTDGLDAAFAFAGNAYFRRGKKYQRFDFQQNKVVETGQFNWNGWQADAAGSSTQKRE